MPGTAVRRWIVTAAAVWCFLIVAAPLWHVELIYKFFSSICHQIPARSWHIGGEPLGVCIRCTSIYFGFLLSLVVGMKCDRRWLQVSFAATAIEILLAFVIVDSLVLRSLTGLALGAAVAPFVVAGVEELLLGDAHELV